MPKQRAPISSRLRNKDKNGTRITPTQEIPEVAIKKEETVSLTHNQLEEDIIFSPRVDTDIYLDELQSPLSFVRGTDEERTQYLKDEDDVMSQSFGSDYKSSLSTSSFYCAQISPPAPSKRNRHLNGDSFILSANKRPPSFREAMSKIQIPFPMVRKTSTSPPSPSSSLSSSTPTPAPASKKSTSTSKAKKTVSSTNSRACATSSALKPLSNTSHQLPTVKEKETRPIKKAVSSSRSHKYMESVSKEKDLMENAPSVALPLCKKLPVYIKMEAKDKEREYWRRQRRVFVHSRFLTNEEGVQVAKTVYSNLSIGPENRLVTSMQGNIANFRTKLRRIFVDQSEKFGISKEYISDTKENQLIYELTAKMYDDTLKTIWDHWIIDPFVDAKQFFLDKSSVNLLRDVTVKLMIIHFKEQYNILSPRQSRAEMRKLDLITRTLVLPDSSELP